MESQERIQDHKIEGGATFIFPGLFKGQVTCWTMSLYKYLKYRLPGRCHEYLRGGIYVTSIQRAG